MSGDPREIVARLDAEGVRHAYIDGGITIQRFLRPGSSSVSSSREFGSDRHRHPPLRRGRRRPLGTSRRGRTPAGWSERIRGRRGLSCDIQSLDVRKENAESQHPVRREIPVRCSPSSSWPARAGPAPVPGGSRARRPDHVRLRGRSPGRTRRRFSVRLARRGAVRAGRPLQHAGHGRGINGALFQFRAVVPERARRRTCTAARSRPSTSSAAS
jgi:hypothetical protein